MDTIPAPIKQRTMLFYWQKKRVFEGISYRDGKNVHTHAVIEDPWLGTRSTNRAWTAFIIVMAEAPTTQSVSDTGSCNAMREGTH